MELLTNGYDSPEIVSDDGSIQPRALVAMKREAGFIFGNLGNTEILFEYLKDHSDKKIEKYYVDIRDIIAENVCNGVFDCDNAYLYGYKLQGFMTGLCGMGYSLLRDIKKDLPCVIALEV